MKFNKQIEIREHQAAVYSIAYDGDYIYSSGGDKFVTRWNLVTGVQDSFSIKFEFAVYTIAIFDHYLFAGLSTGDFHIFDLEKRAEVKHYQQHTKAIFSIQANAVKNQLYVADADGNLSVWSLDTFKLLIYLPLDCGKIRAISISEDGEKIAIGGQDGMIRMMETSHFNELDAWKAHDGGVTSLLFEAEDQECLYSGGKDAFIRKWKTNLCLKSIPAHNYAVYGLIAFNSDLILSSSRDKSIKAWSKELVPLSKLTSREGGHSHSVNSIINLDENHFASCSDDRRIIIWGESSEQ